MGSNQTDNEPSLEIHVQFWVYLAAACGWEVQLWNTHGLAAKNGHTCVETAAAPLHPPFCGVARHSLFPGSCSWFPAWIAGGEMGASVNCYKILVRGNSGSLGVLLFQTGGFQCPW